jgi:hypothetical protein
MLRQAAAKAPDIAWVLADAAALPVADRSFDTHDPRARGDRAVADELVSAAATEIEQRQPVRRSLLVDECQQFGIGGSPDGVGYRREGQQRRS